MSHSCNDFIRLYEIRGNDVGGAKDRDVCKGLREQGAAGEWGAKLGWNSVAFEKAPFHCIPSPFQNG